MNARQRRRVLRKVYRVLAPHLDSVYPPSFAPEDFDIRMDAVVYEYHLACAPVVLCRVQFDGVDVGDWFAEDINHSQGRVQGANRVIVKAGTEVQVRVRNGNEVPVRAGLAVRVSDASGALWTHRADDIVVASKAIGALSAVVPTDGVLAGLHTVAGLNEPLTIRAWLAFADRRELVRLASQKIPRYYRRR